MLEVLHSPRLEDLADQLAEQLCAQRLKQRENILQPIVVVVGHLGIARWLERRIARRFGIFANVRFVLTGEWLNAEMARFGVLEKYDVARFSVNAMTWALYALLAVPERFGLLTDKALLERERFQLAAKLARLFSEYLIYRREWLLDFEQQAAHAPQRNVQGGARLQVKEWQARLWCAMSARLEGGHRAAKFQALLSAINRHASNSQADTPNDAPIYFFGLNHLPPDVLTLLERFSESTLVQIYFPNPCVEYWADVVRERFLAQRRLSGDLLQPDVDGLGGFDHFDVGHPLLASLGGHGQAYFAELSHATADFTEVEAAQDQEQVPPPSLLAALQYGITHLQPDFVPPSVRFDSSIQVFSAQSVVDELNQVKAILFAALLGDPNLQLEEIAIMTPSLSRYAPLLPAVFGAELCASPPIAVQANQSTVHPGARAQSALRYSVLDLTQANLSPLLHQLLQSPELRWEPAQLLELLALDELAAHFELDANDLSLAPSVLERAHIAFGFNDAHRRQLLAAAGTDALPSLPSASLHTWEAGLERLLFGYLHGNQAQIEQTQYSQAQIAQTLLDEAPLEQAPPPASLWPVPDIDVGHAPILSALLQLIRALRIFNFGTQRSRTLPEWTRWLERQIFSFTGAAATDAVRALFAQLELDAAQAKAQDEEVSFVALREACHAAMAQASGRSTPALGAICVCGLVPMRALPFKVVCILGLNEAEFPKPELPDSLNLMRANGARRPGDRSRVQEDRYLFLEAIMATRSQLVLSYQGLGSDGSARQPCSVLTEFLAHMERQFKARLGGTPWIERQFKAPGDTPWFSTALVKPGLVGASLSPSAPIQTILTAPPPEPIKAPKKAVLSVNALLRFWQQPLRTYVQQRLRLAAQQTPDDQTLNADNLEPLGLATPPIQRIAARLLTHALESGSFPKTAPPWLGRSGLLASGALGVQSYANLEQDCRAAWEAINSKFPDFVGAVKQPVRVELNLGETRLSGYIPGVYVAQRACVCVSNKALHGLQRWQLLLRVLLLRASEADALSGSGFGHDSDAPWRALHLGPKAAELVIYASPGEARMYLENLIALRSEYLLDSTKPADCATPPWFWPKLSYTAFSAKGCAHAAVLKVIEAGNAYELANSGLKFWLPNADFFAADSAEFAQFLLLAQTLFAPLAPLAPSTQAQKPENHPAEPPPRQFTVTPLLLPEPNLPLQMPPNTLDLEHFGHDDAADFENEY